MLREVLSGFSIAEGQKLTPGTDSVYKQIAKSERWKADTVDLGEDAKGHWLGHSNAKFIMVYFHGGGYVSAATPGHLKYQFALQHAIRKEGHDFSVFSLSYTLAPKKVYPGQIGQAVAAIRYLVEDMKRDPATILVAGDSAGGNLVSALLLHLARPHPKVSPLTLERPLRAAVLISPWISFQTTTDSFKRNKKSDYLTAPGIHRASNTYIGPGGRHDEYSEPIQAPASWWSDVARTSVEEVFIWGGGGEVLIDSIRVFVQKIQEGFSQAFVEDHSQIIRRPQAEDEDVISEERSAVEYADWPLHDSSGSFEDHSSKASHAPNETVGEEVNESRLTSEEESRVRFVEMPRMAHVEMIIDLVLRIKRKGKGARLIEWWIDQCLKGKHPDRQRYKINANVHSVPPPARPSPPASPTPIASPTIEMSFDQLESSIDDVGTWLKEEPAT